MTQLSLAVSALDSTYALPFVSNQLSPPLHLGAVMAFPLLYISLFHSEMLAALERGFTEKLQFTGSSPCSLSLGEHRHGKQKT